MKGKFSLLALLFALTVSCCWYACSERQDWRPALSDDGSAFPLDEIKRSFARDYAEAPMTRIGSRVDSTDIMNPGYIRPRWDSVMVYQGDNLFQANTTFDAQYDYRVLRWDATDSLLYPMPKRVVVLKDPETEQTASYLRFLIPDTGNTVSDGGDFTGFVLYTTLSGEPVTLGRYDAGELSDSLSVFDSTEPDAESVDRMLGRMEDVFVARVLDSKNPQDPSQPIEPVEIIGIKGPKIIYVNVNFLINKIIDSGGSDAPGIKPPLGDIDFGIGDGGGSSGGGDDGDGNGNGNGDSPFADKTYPVNPKIKYNSNEIRVILDSLNRDCMGQLLINAIRSNVTITSGLNDSSGVRPIVLPLPSGPIITGYEIRIASFHLSPISVMEELMHIYQGVGTVAFGQARMNNEVEAKLLWYTYCMRNGYNKDLGRALGGKEGQDFFNVMYNHILKNNLDNPIYIEAYDNAVRSLRKINTYKNEDKYPYDPGKMECEKLMELIKDCIK